MQRVILHRYTDGLPVQRQRQKSAFPPNFIHSIDSSHMMMTAIECAKEGPNPSHPVLHSADTAPIALCATYVHSSHHSIYLRLDTVLLPCCQAFV